MQRFGFLALIALLSFVRTSPAHDLSFDCTRKAGILSVFAYFDDGTPAQKARVRLVEPGKMETEKATGWTDAQGRWETESPPPGNYVMFVEAGGGHRARQTLRIQETASPAKEPAAGKPVRIGDGPTREEFTRFPWLKAALGLGLIGALAVAFLVSRRKVGVPQQTGEDSP